MKYVSISEMIAIEKEANQKGITYPTMMQKAGEGLASFIQKEFAHQKEKGILGLVGSGNNGGDTLVALTTLAKQGWKTACYLVRPREPEDPLVIQFLENTPTMFSAQNDPDQTVLFDVLHQNEILLDGVLGTGIMLPLREDFAKILQFTQSVTRNHPSLTVIAVDCPSGINCDTGEAAPETISADFTVTMAAMKQGLLKFPAYNFVGKIHLIGIGLPEEGKTLEAWQRVNRFIPETNQIRQWLPDRPKNAHKGTFGTAAIIAGSINYPGAALLAGEAAYRIGAGLVNMAVPGSVQTILAGHLPEAIWTLLPEEIGVVSADAVDIIQQIMPRASALLIGPGFGLEQTTQEFILRLLESGKNGNQVKGGIGFIPSRSLFPKQERTIPAMIIDADALKLLSKIDHWYQKLPDLSILTPHPGEMAVLTGLSKEEIQANRVPIAEEFSRQWGHIVVLKGAFSVIAQPNGETAIIPVATPALARAGTGDVLAGLITGLRAQGLDAYKASVCGAWIHAQAGISATNNIGNPASVLARDILASVKDVINSI